MSIGFSKNQKKKKIIINVKLVVLCGFHGFSPSSSFLLICVFSRIFFFTFGFFLGFIR